MWNKRREEEPPKPYVPQTVAPSGPVAPAPVAPSSVEVKKEATPVSSTPVGKFDSENRGNAASIGKAVKVVGQIFSKEDLYVDGTVEGTVEALEHRLIVGPHGIMQAAIKAREVTALGNIQGNVDAAERIEIRKDAKLVGDIRTARIIIEDGAYFKGSIDIIKPEPKPAPKPPVPAATPAQPVAPTNTAPVAAGPEAKR